MSWKEVILYITLSTTTIVGAALHVISHDAAESVLSMMAAFVVGRQIPTAPKRDKGDE